MVVLGSGFAFPGHASAASSCCVSALGSSCGADVRFGVGDGSVGDDETRALDCTVRTKRSVSDFGGWCMGGGIRRRLWVRTECLSVSLRLDK